MSTYVTSNQVNLYPNPIVGVSKASTAVVTVPVIAHVVSATGTIGSVTGSGTANDPWTATITLMTTTTGLQTGDTITATDGTGTFAAGGEVSVASIVGNKSIVIHKVGGTIPTAGTITDISLPAHSTLPAFLADGDSILLTGFQNGTLTFTPATTVGTTFQATGCSTSGTTLTIGTLVSGTIAVGQVITGVNSALNGLHIVANLSGSGSGSTWTLSSAPGTLSTQIVTGIFPGFQIGETITQATSGATGVVTGVTYNGSSSTVGFNTAHGTFDTTHFVYGGTSKAALKPTATAGMTELATAGHAGTNQFYYKNVTGTTFELYTDSGLTTGVDSSAFTTAVANTGQYNTATITKKID